ncbi:MAG: phage portal protein [Opitutales bacterium]
MGLIAQRLAEFSETRNDPGWLTRDDGEETGSSSSSGVRVTRNSAMSLTTVWRCVDLLTSTVAQAPRDVIVKIGSRSFPEYANRPGWLSSPNPADPTFTISDYFAQIAASVLFDGNYFVWVYPNVVAPQMLTPIDPARVTVKKGPLYELKDEQGKTITTLTPMEMLHGTWLRLPGQLRGISPLEALRRSIGAAIAAEDFGARFFGQGAAMSFGVEVPTQLTPEQKAELSQALRKRHQGLVNSHAIGVLTAGAKFVTGLAPTPEQAQMLATRKFSVEDLCRPFGVPPGMVGSQEAGASSYASAEAYADAFRKYAVLPLARRIEAQHDRLLELPAGITDPSASMQFRFNLDWIVRADILQRYQAHAAGVTGGFLTPNEPRAMEDLPPLPGGDRLYMQQQMVPIAQLGSDNDMAVARARAEFVQKAYLGVGKVWTSREARAEIGLPGDIPPQPPEARSSEQDVRAVHNHVHLPDALKLEIPAPIVNVAPAEPVVQPAPVVSVQVDNREVADAMRDLIASLSSASAEEVRAIVSLAERERVAPIVNVSVPDTQRVELVATPKRLTRRTVKRDRGGQILETLEQSVDA